ncbi:MAG: hypothetical protein AAF404_16635, partial [Pseudomonadota bacterium]
LILVEVSGMIEATKIADALAWHEYYLAVSDWSTAMVNAYFALETAVISKVPIVSVTEWDTQIDTVLPVLRNGSATDIPVAEQRLSSEGIADFGEPLARTDRGTLQVDLANGLSIFPVHLKSNRNNACFGLHDAIKNLRRFGFTVTPAMTDAYDNGFAAATSDHLKNAKKRERVIAAVSSVATGAVTDNNIPVIAGDFNTAFEPGKYGSSATDCRLADFGCRKMPFPAAACSGADGFDDTLGILEEGLAGSTRWTFLSRYFTRTYDDTAFADLAIDHIAVPVSKAAYFRNAKLADQTYGSDHFPLIVDYLP